MPQQLTETIFRACWFFLLLIAVSAHLVFRGKRKKKADLLTNALVAVPYLIVFGWFSVRGHIGTYNGNLLTQGIGILCMGIGVAGYIVSILFLRRNWAVSAAIKEGHTLVVRGPYKYVRHPMYSFIMVVILGSGLLISNYMMLAYLPVILAVYYLRAGKEEELLKKELSGYVAYAQNTKMFIPGIF